jgi:hypothetical protein
MGNYQLRKMPIEKESYSSSSDSKNYSIRKNIEDYDLKNIGEYEEKIRRKLSYKINHADYRRAISGNYATMKPESKASPYVLPQL